MTNFLKCEGGSATGDAFKVWIENKFFGRSLHVSFATRNKKSPIWELLRKTPYKIYSSLFKTQITQT